MAKRSTAKKPVHSSRDTTPKTRGLGPRDGEILFLFLRCLFQHMDALISLPDLIRILILVEFQKLSIRIEGGLYLHKFIVTESAKKPGAGKRGFEFRSSIQAGQGFRIVPCQIVGGGKVLPVDSAPGIELKGGFQFP